MYNFVREKRSGFEITMEEIQQIEEKYNFKFPAELIDYYLECNGARVKLCYFDADYDDEEYDDEEFEYEVRWIVPLKYGELTFEHIVENCRDYMDNDMFPIAGNQGGDYYYWNKNNEKVYLYYDDDLDNPVFICHNIKRFFEKLSNSDIENKS